MLPQEYLLLNSPRLSHPARSLYMLQLRRLGLQQHPVALNYPELGRSLAIEDPTTPSGFSYQVTARQLTQLLNELMQIGLIQLQDSAHNDEHYHGKFVELPVLKTTPTIPIKQSAFAMFAEWRPDDSFINLGRMCGLIDSYYDDTDLGEFIAYWLGHPDRFETQHQWMLKFIKQLKSKRYRKPITESIGYQTIQSSPTTMNNSEPSQRALEMIAHAEKLKLKADDQDEK